MKPKRIILVRHGESEANADWSKHGSVPDYPLRLTEEGQAQAFHAGTEILHLTEGDRVTAYVSPYYRARQTFGAIAEVLGFEIGGATEDPRLREQDWGHLRTEAEGEVINTTRDEYGTFFYRIPDGESGADVFDRVSTFLETLHRDFEKDNFPNNCLIVTHGLTLRLFLMRWFHWTVEEFEAVRNPRNGQVVVMILQEDGKYKLWDTLQRGELKRRW